MSEGLKIVEFWAENFKKLKVVQVKPESSTVVISGKNEQGKSSLLDAIWSALGGAAANKGLKKPIREGESSATVRLDLGDIIVTRKWTSDDTSYLTVENRDGAVFKSPQAILDTMIGNLAFDPLAFAGMDEKKQKEVLLDLAKIDLDLAKWEAERKGKYDERTLVNRRVTEITGQIAGLPVVPEGTPDEEITASTIISEVEAAQKIKDNNDSDRRDIEEERKALNSQHIRVSSIRDTIASTIAEIERLQDELIKLKEDEKQAQYVLNQKIKGFAEIESKVAALVDPDMETFKERLMSIDTINKAVRNKAKRSLAESQKAEYEAQSAAFTAEIEALDRQKTEAIKAAQFPIEALGFDDLGVTYKGIPFKQCSAAERLRVSVSMAVALNPKLRVIRIMDGSLLDSQNMAVIEEMVRDNGYQVWVEKVQEGPGVGVYIYDGEIVTTEEKEAA